MPPWIILEGAAIQMETKEINILILSAGRRVELTNCFKAARDRLGITGKVIAADCSDLAPALYFADVQKIVPPIRQNEDYIASIIDICKKENVSLVVPTIDTELMLLADIAITDYSSWIYDFVLTRKPGFIYATDLEQYDNERGFYYKLETTPFAIAKNNRELVNNIQNFDMDAYQAKVEEFLQGKGCVEDGKASYRVVEKIKEIIGETK